MPLALTTGMPLEEAVASFGARTPVGSLMRAREWEALPAELRARSFWISTVENERILEEANRRIAQAIAHQRDLLASGEPGILMNRGRFIAELQDELEAIGYVPPEGLAGSIQDISSAGRLGLVWDMNLAQARGYAHWLANNDAAILRMRPCQELVRVEARIEPRDWPAVWEENGGEFFGDPGPDYPDAPGRMIARVDSLIWIAISRFGVPWPPFDWGSGMGLGPVRRTLALELGVIKVPDVVMPQDRPFNTALQASVRGISPAGRRRMQAMLGDTIQIDGDTAVYQPLTQAQAIAGPRGSSTGAAFAAWMAEAAATAKRAKEAIAAADATAPASGKETAP